MFEKVFESFKKNKLYDIIVFFLCLSYPSVEFVLLQFLRRTRKKVAFLHTKSVVLVFFTPQLLFSAARITPQIVIEIRIWIRIGWSWIGERSAQRKDWCLLRHMDSNGDAATPLISITITIPISNH